ncbi:putative baseplate assembly protein [Haloterrigena longa]|uniref:Putative baseplate assembly protein n=1 Tax=Natrinema longum TaxID=370324 RepID=A0A8A2UJR4_9EURY|nr:putative baseplate assembly protein [Natrinema longum]MBZ6495316.1 putative baseplate assembly protein [Natrinema longum]QSW86968.1 putative baseplate assembly protein [Natrinema longum]
MAVGIDVPELDDRSYEEILSEATKLIPAYAEEWTDLNPHDPGVTILEMLAWLTETYVYQLDRVTDDHREKYLALMGERRRPPTPASTRLRLGLPDDAGWARIPAGTRVSVADADDADTSYRFETDHALTLTAATLERVLTVTGSGRTDNTHANRTGGMFYRAFGDDAADGDAFYLGFDADPFARARTLTLTVSYHDDDLPEPATHGSIESSFEPSVEPVWEYRDEDDGSWRRLAVAADGTNAFYRGGPITLARPDAGPATASNAAGPEPPTDVGSSGRTWLRCRLETAGHEIPPQFDAIESNVVSVSHRESVTDEELTQVGHLEEAPALDGQTYAFERSPVLSATVFVDGQRWQEVPDFDASGPDDPHFVLDREAGTVTFGDGAAGRVPPAAGTVRADYVAGGGADGNVPATTVWHLSDPDRSLEGPVDAADIEVDPVDGATGGADGETIADALDRVRRDRRLPYRAITADDYRYVAAHTPGLRIGRTNVLVEDGEITVVVVPFAPPDVGTPEPSEGFLRAVRRHVGERKLLSDRVDVIGPRYVGLEISVAGRARARYAGGGHDVAVRTAIEEFVHPLMGDGGDGWPFGHTLHRSELVDRIADLDAIDRVSEVTITAHGGATVDDGSVRIDDTSLFAVEDVTTNLSIRTGSSDGGG